MQLLEIFEKGNYSKIIDYWNNKQLQASQDPDSAFIAAAAHFRLGNLEKACEICELIEGPLSNNASFLSMYAAILRRLSLLTRAEEVFQQALSLEPNSKEIKNNYSNLLIDQKKYDQAANLLEEILQDSPSYQDAISNLERCKSILQEAEASKVENKKIKGPKNKTPDDVFGDPLEDAFSPSEVDRTGGKIGQATAAVYDLLDTNDPKNIEEAGLELLKLATEMINKKQYSQSISILEDIRKSNNGLNPQTYKLASDAFIGLERFKEAEIFALMALQNGEKTMSIFINLASFAAMRKDQFMAKHWIIEAGKIDSNNENLNKCRELLFPSDKSREEDEPFKLR